MSEEKKTEKLGLAEMLGEAGIDVSAVGLSKSGHRSGVAFGIKEPISDALIAFAKRTNRSKLWNVMTKGRRKQLSKDAQKEATEKPVFIVDWKVAKRAVFAEIDRMQKNLGKKPKVITADVAKPYGVYRTNNAGEYMIAQKTDQGRKPQMIGVVKNLAKKLEARDIDYLNAGDEREPVLVVAID